ncbi:hypothetical protein T12_3221 [Trichinella patagoniensis]|uniref:Uncharacterized protein n=1 Tax=Trichinella patagoniensis TaxID=990121 RepID=A0A0V0YW22_9BILA|nr:hypothetical protein T12_3221 [Trichinella patagoniensis]
MQRGQRPISEQWDRLINQIEKKSFMTLPSCAFSDTSNNKT